MSFDNECASRCVRALQRRRGNPRVTTTAAVRPVPLIPVGVEPEFFSGDLNRFQDDIMRLCGIVKLLAFARKINISKNVTEWHCRGAERNERSSTRKWEDDLKIAAAPTRGSRSGTVQMSRRDLCRKARRSGFQCQN
ncbi:hypothetical protein EVAR_37072_1 [Eumeta japonica]|uniref:Uncharacterized protein n=1 Tax=Eumeta variegata TaxID=151549 RepID=A0A4C1WIL5_EUMVA|nr:hypothetical protein EVAR_37072_1 [Eumeta japonica]